MKSLSGKILIWLVAIAMSTWLGAAFMANLAATTQERSLDACVVSACD